MPNDNDNDTALPFVSSADLQAVVARNPELLRRGRFARFTFGIDAVDQQWLIHVDKGRVSVDERRFDPTEAAFVISAPRAVWADYSTVLPRPGHHDLTAMIESRNATATGDLMPYFANTLFVKGVVAALFKADASW